MFEKTPDTLFRPFRPMLGVILPAILIAAGVMVYSNSFHAYMVFDDHPFIIADPAVHMTKLSWESIKRAALEGFPAHRYLPNISFAINYYFGRLDPFGYHLVNLCIHLLSGIFLFFFVRLTLQVDPGAMKNMGFGHLSTHDRRSEPCSRFFSWAWPTPTTKNNNKNQRQLISPQTIAFFTALIWIVQPVGTQAVTYICQRMASMVALFYVLSLLLYIKGRMGMVQRPGKILAPILYFAGSALAALCAIATKENAGTLPIAILLYEWFFFQDLKLQWSRNQILFALIFVLIFGGAVVWYMGGNPLIRLMNSYNIRDFNMLERTLTQFRIVIYYVSLFLFAPPGRLNLDHDYPLSTALFSPPTTFVCMIAIAALILFAGFIAKKERLISFCILWFFLTQATESTIIGIELIFEHRTYIPFMMTSLMAVMLCIRLIPNKTAACALICCAALLFSFWAYERNADWQDPVRFWSDALAKSSDKQRAHQNLAFAYQQQGKWDLAVSHYLKSLDMDKTTKRTDFATLANLGAALLKQEHYFDAAYYYSQAMGEKNAAANILHPLAHALSRIGEIAEAKHYYQLVLTIDPQNALAQKELKALTAFSNQYPDPGDQILQLLSAMPKNPGLFLKQGEIFLHKGENEKAIAAFQKAEAMTGGHDAMLRQSLVSRLARAYAVSRRFGEAEAAYLRLITLAPNNGMAYYNLAAVYAVTGNAPKAMEFLKKAEENGIQVQEKTKTDPNFVNLEF